MATTKVRRISAAVAVLGAVLLGVGALTSSNPAFAAVESDAPVLTSISRTSPATVSPPTDATLAFQATDAGSGVGLVSGTFQAPNGGFFVLLGSGTNEGTFTFDVTDTSASGTYELWGVTVTDLATENNTVTYLRDGTIRKDTAGSTAPATHQLDFDAADFTVDNDGGDATNPVLASITRTSPATIEAPGNITLGYTAADAGTGLSLVGAVYRAPDNAIVVSDFVATEAGTLTVAIGESALSGKYELLTVRLADKAVPANDVFYNRDGSITKQTAGSTGPTAHTLDFDAADVIVDNDGGDETNPVLTAISRTSGGTIADPPGTITLSYTATDAGAGVASAAASFFGPGNRFYNSAFVAGPNGTLTVSLPADAPDGTYQLVIVRVTDKAIPANDVAYNRDGTITKLSEGSSGPGTHTLDFDAADVIVGTPSSSTSSSTSTSTTSSSTSSSSTTSTTAAGGSSTTTPGGSTTTTAGPGGGASGIQLSSQTVAPGGTLRITSPGWKGTVQAIMRSDPVLLGALTANAAGVVTGEVRIPVNATLGTHTLELVGTGTDGKPRVASTTFTVSRTATGQLPKTGATTVPIAWAGGALLLAGIVGVAIGDSPAPAGQRRRTRR